mmetsp:Transcript_12607/g.23667  ORF Transcript_12607/g.23667 Transcript_12607/m.23667 type:complete len:164 (+) Transcript_12607:302-793(+)
MAAPCPGVRESEAAVGGSSPAYVPVAYDKDAPPAASDEPCATVSFYYHHRVRCLPLRVNRFRLDQRGRYENDGRKDRPLRTTQNQRQRTTQRQRGAAEPPPATSLPSVASSSAAPMKLTTVRPSPAGLRSFLTLLFPLGWEGEGREGGRGGKARRGGEEKRGS